MIFLGSNVRTQQSTLHEIQAISQGKFGRPSSIPFLYTFGQLEGNSDMTEPDEALDVSTRLSLLVSPIIGRVEHIMHMRKKLLQEIQKSQDIQTIVHVALYEILAIDF